MMDSDAEVDEVLIANDRAKLRALMQCAFEIFYKKAYSNIKSVEKFILSNASDEVLVEEI